MKDKKNHFEIYIKENGSDEIVPMSKLTRGLMHILYSYTYNNKLPFKLSDELRSGLSIEELELCAKYWNLYLQRAAYGINWDDSYGTQSELAEMHRVFDKITPQLEDIVKILGEPQGRFTI